MDQNALLLSSLVVYRQDCYRECRQKGLNLGLMERYLDEAALRLAPSETLFASSITPVSSA